MTESNKAAAAYQAQQGPASSPEEAGPAPDVFDAAVVNQNGTEEEELEVAIEPVQDNRSIEELRAALMEAERLRDEYLDQAQRGRADYHNLRRRKDEESAAALDRGAQRLIEKLLGVLDNFGYVVDALGEPGDEEASQLAKGVRMVYAELFGAMESAGLEPIPGVGSTFDPAVHEALLSEEAEQSLDEPVVTDVLRRGYRFKGRTLRPASVKVRR